MRPFAWTLLLLLLIACFDSAFSYAGWIENGIPLTSQLRTNGQGAIVSDGSSGAVIVFQASHNGARCLVAQHIDSLGAPMWGPEGVDIARTTGGLTYPQIISDGAGGAIIAWIDSPSGTLDVFAQRVSAQGTVLWAGDGVALCAATGNQRAISMVTDDAGGAIVAWHDDRSGDYDIYAQRVGAEGNVLWTANGKSFCTATGSQVNPAVASDNSGGAIIAWKDERNFGDNGNIYAQRADASGILRWQANGIPICTAAGTQQNVRIEADGNEGAIVVWQDARNGSYDICAQSVDTAGIVQWIAGGVAICTAVSDQTVPCIVSDRAAGAIIAWQDFRSGGSDIFAQRVDAQGAVLWTSDGVGLCTALGDEAAISLASDGAGGAVAAWEYSRGYLFSDIYSQRVSADGTVEWAVDGVILCAAPGAQTRPAIISREAGGTIALWSDDREWAIGIYAQRMDNFGTIQWEADGAAICIGTGLQAYPSIVADGEGGAIVAWNDSRNSIYSIYVQRIGHSGVPAWASEGIRLGTGPQGRPTIIADGVGGAIVVWYYSPGANYYICAQKVDGAGVVSWDSDGVILCAAAEERSAPTITSDGAGGAIVAWQSLSSSTYDIYAQRVDVSGVARWTANGIPICTATKDQTFPAIIPDGEGGAFVTWQDGRTGEVKVYAQRLHASGAIVWSVDGIPLCSAAGSQRQPAIVSDGAGGAIVTWEDSRPDSVGIFAQRVNALGEVLWSGGGIPICTAPSSQIYPAMVSDNSGGAIITWQDHRNGNYDIFAQRVNGLGTTLWTLDGVSLCSSSGDQLLPELGSDGGGGAIAAWQDLRNGSYGDIFSQRVGASGVNQWAMDGEPLCTAAFEQGQHQIASDGAGGGIVAWHDRRCDNLIFAQRINASGELVSTALRSFSAARAGMSVRIGWDLSEVDPSAHFQISRASAPEWRFIGLENVAIEHRGPSYVFVDVSCQPGSTYMYRVECEVAGAARKVLFETNAITVPALPATLYQNCPNPFNPNTVIRFYLPENQEIVLEVYNVAGQRVAMLVRGRKEKGFHEVTWNGRNAAGIECSSGVYFSRLKAGKITDVRKMILLR